MREDKSHTFQIVVVVWLLILTAQRVRFEVNNGYVVADAAGHIVERDDYSNGPPPVPMPTIIAPPPWDGAGWYRVTVTRYTAEGCTGDTSAVSNCVYIGSIADCNAWQFGTCQASSMPTESFKNTVGLRHDTEVFCGSHHSGAPSLASD